jgi:hypothetical protein
LLLHGHVQRLTARHEQLQVAHGGDELRETRRTVEDLLDVVEEEKRAPVAEETAQVVPGANRLGNRRLDQVGLADLVQRDPPNVLESVHDLRSELKGEPGLAGTGRADQRQQSPAAEQLSGLGELPFTAD